MAKNQKARVMVAGVMRDALTSAIKKLELVELELGELYTGAELSRDASVALLDRQLELRKTRSILGGVLDSIPKDATLGESGISQKEVKGGWNGKSKSVGQSGVDVRSRRRHRV